MAGDGLMLLDPLAIFGTWLRHLQEGSYETARLCTSAALMQQLVALGWHLETCLRFMVKICEDHGLRLYPSGSFLVVMLMHSGGSFLSFLPLAVAAFVWEESLCEAGLRILQQGGTAADACVAAAAALNVTEPCNTGLGARGSVHCLQGCGRSPAALTLERVRAHPDVAGSELNPLSALCVTVPGSAAAWEAAVQRWGVKTLRQNCIRERERDPKSFKSTTVEESQLRTEVSSLPAAWFGCYFAVGVPPC
eukprot:Skav207975  [mRNA]  locus=scaffold3328:4085:6484:- [translate_table: standard]